MMSTARLKVLHSRETRNRKFLCVMNDVAKTQQDLYDGYIEQEKVESVQRLQKSIVHTRRNVVRQRVLKECMKTTRDEVEHSDITDLYGKYHGVPIEHIAGEIDTYLENNHPRIRRDKKIRQLFKEGYESGAILDKDTIDNKVKEYFDRPLVEVHHIAPESLDQKRHGEPVLLPPLAKGFYTGSVYTSRKSERKPSRAAAKDEDNTQTKLFVNRKVSKFLAEHVPDNVSLHSANDNVQPYKSKKSELRPTTLPPIKPTQAEQGVPRKAESIGDLVHRFNQEGDKQVHPVQKGMKRRTDNTHCIGEDKNHKHTKKEKSTIENDNVRAKHRHERRERRGRGADKSALHKGTDDDLKSLTLPPLKLKNKSHQKPNNLGMTF